MLIIYEPSGPLPGYIEQTIMDPVHPDLPRVYREAGKTTLEWSEPFDPTKSYVSDDRIVARPLMDVRAFFSDPSKPMRLRGFPVGAAIAVRMDGLTIKETTASDPDLELTFSASGSYTIAAELWPYIPFTCTLTVTP